MKICHVTCVHKPEDVRIFHKECISLVNAGYDVYLVEQGNTYDKLGVHIIGIGELPVKKIRRILFSSKKAYQVAKELNCDVYHVHDPELLPYAMKLKKQGKKVIFDSHEDVPGQIKDKKWIPRFFRKVVAFAYKCYETHVVKHLTAVVAATDHIASLLKNRALHIVVINNYPKLNDIIYHDNSFDKRENLVCYAGGINEDRGERIMIEAMRDVHADLMIAGNHPIEDKRNVHYIGMLDRPGVNELYKKAVIGLCILKPIENYFYSQPIKIYEYMAAGLPFICSDFPKWRKIVEESQAGVCVDPTSSHEIKKAITDLLSNRTLAQDMGRRGRRYIIEKCNWNTEEKILLELYQNIC